METLNKIQKELKAPKGQKNTFGNYNYRSCEDILEAVKPHLGSATLTIHDEIVYIGERYYVKATATLTDGAKEVRVCAYARESDTKKGMDVAQITGAASSYARKYALSGLFAIDDTKDADTKNNTEEILEFIDTKQVQIIKDVAVELKIDKEKFLKYMGVAKVESIVKPDFKKAVAALESKRPKA